MERVLYILLYVIVGVVGISAISYILYRIFRSPFKYPYHIIKFDVTGKRNPDVNNLIDSYINQHGFDEFQQHFDFVKKWKADCKERIKKSKMKRLRSKQLEEVVDDERMFCFDLVRKQTRYRQVNYVKSSYFVFVTVGKFYSNYKTLKRRYEALAEINFECTLSEFNSKEQRKLMTASLRDEIAKRDNYTCQICGKYMPDGVGLHIDHIIPIKKGGKSVPSNLQVLCSKCNGKKSST